MSKASPRGSQSLSDSAPDLEILGDQVTLHPSGYTEPPEREDGKERVLMEHMARFRTNPLNVSPSAALLFIANTKMILVPPRNISLCVWNGIPCVRQLHRAAHILFRLLWEHEDLGLINSHPTEEDFRACGEKGTCGREGRPISEEYQRLWVEEVTAKSKHRTEFARSCRKIDGRDDMQIWEQTFCSRSLLSVYTTVDKSIPSRSVYRYLEWFGMILTDVLP